MVTTAEFDVKQAILVNGPFGPAEVKQIREAISRDHANFQLLRDAVNELQAKEEQTPASMVRLGVATLSPGPLLSGLGSAQAGRRRGDGPLLPGQVAVRPRPLPGSRRKATSRRKRRATTRANAPWAGPRPSAMPATRRPP